MNLLRASTRSLSQLPKVMKGPFPSHYVVNEVESRWYDWWESHGLFRPSKVGSSDESSKHPVFSLLLPPPNVTGSLHLGHALTVTIQDSLCRWMRMKGREVLWIPGADHAGIATQAVVEKHLLASRNIQRSSMSREDFLNEVQDWKSSKGGLILKQLRSLGASLDWSREYFTLDSDRSQAVDEAFLRLYEKDLIYRGNFLVNFSCSLSSTISDIEVDWMEIKGKTKITVPGYEKPIPFGIMYDVAYKLVDEPGEIIVSTTRPETIPGDVAIAVHPKDERYSKFIGSRVQNPLCPSRTLPVIGDEYVSLEMGTGALKITPGHDQNDYEIGIRHKLPIINILSEEGRLNVPWDSEIDNLPRFTARLHIIKKLKALDHLRNISTEHCMKLPKCSRSGDIVEKVIKPQWFIRTKELYERAKRLVEEEDSPLHISPDQFQKIWKRWLSNEIDWCISRQLWWGHRIPMWYCSFSDGSQEWIPGKSEEEIKRKVENSQRKLTHCLQDPDVLDTWFSSALLPLSSLGWPHSNAEEDLQKYYPFSVMETGHDILFFWVARMVMLCSELRKDGRVPFNEVFLHGLICDAQGRKMSKSLGNVVDPYHVINGISLPEMISNIESSLQSTQITTTEADRAIKGLKKGFPKGIPQIGTDGLRFGLLSYDVQGEMINLDINLIQSSGAFCNKLWQMTRFFMMAFDRSTHLEEIKDMSFDKSLKVEDKWILHCTAQAVNSVNSAFEDKNFHSVTKSLRSFLYGQVCDVYLEIIKTTLSDPFHTDFATKLKVLEDIIITGMHLIHPVCPFLSEEIYQRIKSRLYPEEEISSLMSLSYPDSNAWNAYIDETLSSRMTHALSIVSSIRSLRLLNKISNKERPDVIVYTADPKSLQDLKEIIENLSLSEDLKLLCSKDSKHQEESGQWSQTFLPETGDVIKVECSPNHRVELKGIQHRKNILQGNADKYRSQLNKNKKAKKAQIKLDAIAKEMSELDARAAILEDLLRD